jgi:TolB protein
MNADGSNLLAVSAEGEEELITPGTWSPDGTRLAIPVTMVQINTLIFTVAADGTDRQDLTDGTTPDTHPTWSPDGEWIAFGRRQDDTRYLMVMAADGSDQTQLFEPMSGFSGPPYFRPEP